MGGWGGGQHKNKSSTKSAKQILKTLFWFLYTVASCAAIAAPSHKMNITLLQTFFKTISLEVLGGLILLQYTPLHT